MADPDRAALQAALELAMRRTALARSDGTRAAEAISLHVAVMRDAGGALDIRARVTGGGRSICFCEAEAVDTAGAIAAQAMGTFRLRGPE
jgi:acyl-coenzyme A thioesterase PaaI-like protein